MSVLTDVLGILTAPPGGMAYYLVLLYSIWSIVGLALSRWSRGERRGLVPRLLIAGGLMSFGRFILFVIALLDQRSEGYLVLLGPPTERLVDALCGALICWAFVIPSRRRTVAPQRVGDSSGHVFIGMISLFVVGLYVIGMMQWSTAWQSDNGTAYNLSWQRWAWELGQLVFIIPVLAYLVAVPVQERGMLLVAIGILGAGHLLQAVYPLAEQIPHFAGWVRFANLIVFPLLAVTAFRLVVQQFDVRAAELGTISQKSLSQVTGLMNLLDTHHKMNSSLDLDTVLENAMRGVSQVVQTHLCALAFISQEQDEKMELAVVYDAPQIADPQMQFHIKDYPVIQHAIVRNKPVVLKSDENGHVMNVYRLLGNSQCGPLIVQPLEAPQQVGDSKDKSVAMGVLLVCRPGQAKPFTEVEIHKCETLSRHIAAAVENANCYRTLETRNDHLMADLRLMQMEYSRTKVNLENQLKQSQKELSIYIQKLYETELSEQRIQNDAQKLRQQLRTSRTELEQTSAELQQSIRQISVLTQRIAQMDAAHVGMRHHVQALEDEKANLHAQLLESRRVSVEAELWRLPGSFAERRDEQAEARDEFLASLAQELRTPMTSIVGYAELMLDDSIGKLEGLQRKFLERIQANVERMSGMLNDLIGVIAIDSGKLKIDLDMVDLLHVIERALGRIQFRLEEKELEYQLDVGDLPIIHADSESVQQIVDNLLTNACKSSQPGSNINLYAHVETDNSDEPYLHVAVSDTGGGIAPKDRSRVFQRWYRAGDALIAGLGETGVGLSIVKALVEAHQGRVWIESEMGVGTTFHLTIPARLEGNAGV
jgi:signal transduction histidine kinase